MADNNGSNLAARWHSWAPYLRSALPIIVAFLYMQHGMMKLFAFPAGMGPNNSTVQLFSQFGLAGILETFGGLLMLVGLCSRPIAFIRFWAESQASYRQAVEFCLQALQETGEG